MVDRVASVTEGADPLIVELEHVGCDFYAIAEADAEQTVDTNREITNLAVHKVFHGLAV